PTRDGRWVAIACTSDRMFARLAEVMGRPELAAPDRYAKAAARIGDRETVERLVGDWTAGHDADALIEICVAGEVPCGLVHTIADIFASPLYRERGTLARVDDARAGPLTVPAVVPRLSATPGRIDHLGPALGDGNARIYGDLLGLDPAEIERLKAARVI
ncbi:MAG: CoA transferase, partial [Hyphomicrobiales bacterium]|nr:CoA transferase [Hyphomicrobiales bacterium]